MLFLNLRKSDVILAAQPAATELFRQVAATCPRTAFRSTQHPISFTLPVHRWLGALLARFAAIHVVRAHISLLFIIYGRYGAFCSTQSFVVSIRSILFSCTGYDQSKWGGNAVLTPSACIPDNCVPRRRQRLARRCPPLLPTSSPSPYTPYAVRLFPFLRDC